MPSWSGLEKSLAKIRYTKEAKLSVTKFSKDSVRAIVYKAFLLPLQCMHQN